MRKKFSYLMIFSITIILISACSKAEKEPVVDQSWKWSIEKIEQVVNKVRAGKSLVPQKWLNGARVAVCLSFDVDNETVWLRNADSSIGGLSQGEYGSRVALPRIIKLLDKYNIPASFFIPAVSLMIKPDMANLIMKSGRHEIGVHGWIHEKNSMLPENEERELLIKSIEYLNKVTGTKPVGYRAPSWNFSPSTLKLLMELGFIYDSSLMSDDYPYEINADGKPTGIVELPIEWILDDYPLFNPLGNVYDSPRSALNVFIDEYEEAYKGGGVFVLTMHPHVIGHRSRIVILEELIKYINAKGNVWFATHRQVAEYVKKEADL